MESRDDGYRRTIGELTQHWVTASDVHCLQPLFAGLMKSSKDGLNQPFYLIRNDPEVGLTVPQKDLPLFQMKMPTHRKVMSVLLGTSLGRDFAVPFLPEDGKEFDPDDVSVLSSFGRAPSAESCWNRR
ncbi:hypothetical protein M427DRAFT_31023 [Gonapodya prolifera JEL478]|uniref:Uncharacterized protein n=1 Tax=Gonapodya prolifera (strain JEL478) TaxID=1344416 RepID=A0A139AIG8_GONPJ|nr:hypothetical protein M427DRAFT_31023 [Gonapodya prolifera JEL478]|eukprot:KXS16602.1 hypothetical protein M427DRAFT_31023 [Gonapodya prolifera JEL478]